MNNRQGYLGDERRGDERLYLGYYWWKDDTTRDTFRTREETRWATHACRGNERRSSDTTPALSLFLSAHCYMRFTWAIYSPQHYGSHAQLQRRALHAFEAIHSPMGLGLIWPRTSSRCIPPPMPNARTTRPQPPLTWATKNRTHAHTCTKPWHTRHAHTWPVVYANKHHNNQMINVQEAVSFFDW
jgi:hypothetical protein